MALPVISNIFRVTFNHVPASGHPSHNVMHFSSAGNEAGLAADIDAALGTLAADSHLFWPMSSSWKCTTIDVLALDGTGTTQTFTLTNDQQGGASGAAVYQAAGIVSLHTALRGSRGRGRVYIGPAAEDAQADGILNSTGKALCQTAWNTFKLEVGLNGSPLYVASYAHSTAQIVETCTVQNYIATQRRRAKFLQ